MDVLELELYVPSPAAPASQPDPRSRGANPPGPKPRPPLVAKDIQGLKYFKILTERLSPLRTHQADPNRKLHYDDLAKLVVLYFLNPVLTSLRGIRQATGLKNVQEKLAVASTSLGSLSEASHRFDSSLLRPIIQDLASQAQALDAHPRPAALAKDLEVLAVDGSLIEALPRMAWALWLDPEHRAGKMHLDFDIFRGIPKNLVLTDANASETRALRKRLEANKLYVMDAGFADYQLLEDIRQAGSSFIARLHDNAAYEVIEERPLTEADRKAGVVFDRVVRLGCKTTRSRLSGPVRVIQVHVKNPPSRGLAPRSSRVSSKKTFRHQPEEYDLLIVTDMMELPAGDIALLFRYRWSIELFFRWLKCILRFKHLIFESKNGVEILAYVAVIVSLLITLWTGRKPTKRALEMIQLYLQGWATEAELAAYFERLKRVDP